MCVLSGNHEAIRGSAQEVKVKHAHVGTFVATLATAETPVRGSDVVWEPPEKVAKTKPKENEEKYEY